MQTLSIIPAWVWILASSVFFALGEFLSKKFAINPGWTWVVLFLIADVISALLWLPAIFEKNQLSITGVVWSIASVMATVAIGVFAFGEELTIIQSIGLGVGVVSLVLLSI